MLNPAPRFPKASELSGRKVSELVSIVDLSGLNKSHFHSATTDFIRKLTQIDQEYYPGNGTLYMVNVPWLFKAAWSVINPWLADETREKVHIIRNNVHEALEFVGDSVLPESLGGLAAWNESE